MESGMWWKGRVWLWKGSRRDPRGDWISVDSLFVILMFCRMLAHGELGTRDVGLSVLSVTVTCELAVGSAWNIWVFLKHAVINTHTHAHTHTQICLETPWCGWWVLQWRYHFSFLASSLCLLYSLLVLHWHCITFPIMTRCFKQGNVSIVKLAPVLVACRQDSGSPGGGGTCPLKPQVPTQPEAPSSPRMQYRKPLPLGTNRTWDTRPPWDCL